MTQREFFTKVIEANINEELTAKAQELVAGLDKRNAQKSATQTKTQKENEVLKAEMLNKLEKGKGYLAAEIGVVMGFSTSKASALAKQLVDEGKATVADVKVKGKGMQKSYTILVEPIEVDEIDE
jgi:predicted O-methyltransferase YrrM